MRSERGSITVAALGVVAVIVALVVGLAGAGQLFAARERAVHAAEAAALAAAPVTFRPFGALGTAQQEAARFARANGAVLLECSCAHDASYRPRRVVVSVQVVVSVLGWRQVRVEASAAAEFRPTALLG